MIVWVIYHRPPWFEVEIVRWGKTVRVTTGCIRATSLLSARARVPSGHRGRRARSGHPGGLIEAWIPRKAVA